MENTFFLILNYFIDLFFFLDIIIAFRCVVYDDKGEEIATTSAMACDYLQSTFIVDILATVPFDLFVPGENI